MGLLLLVFLPCILWKMEFHKTAFHADALSLEKTGAVKGILAVLIVLHHLSQNLEMDGVLGLLLNNVGVLCVALFFFFSGYGLQKSYQGKPHYRETILKKRIPSVLVPYVFLIFLYWLLSGIVSEPYTLSEVLFSLINGRPIVSFSWYTLCILITYVNYFLSTLLFCRQKKGIFLYNGVCTVLWVFLCRRLGYAEYWYNAAIAFPLGIFWAVYGEKITPWLCKHYLPTAILSFAIFGVSYSVALIARKTDVFVSLYWIACVGFLLFVVLILMKFTFRNPILSFLGKLSFELYSIHGFFMILYRNEPFRVEGGLMWPAAVMASSIAAAWMLHRFFRWTLKKLLC